MDNSISLISKIRDKANNLIVSELEKNGISGIVTSHGEIIVNLFKAGSLTKKEIAEKIGRDKSTVTVLIDKLEKNGYVKQEKKLQDTRYTVISLTEKAKVFEGKFMEISQAMFDIEYKGISNLEQKEFLKTLNKIFSNFKEAGF